MIIAREREILGILVDRDKAAKKVYREACEFGNDEDIAKKIYEANLYHCACDIDEGNGIKDPRMLWDGLRELDEKSPYDDER